MTDCFDLLPEWAKEKLSISSQHREWKKCACCHVYSTDVPLKACSACADRPQPMFYCSKACQKKDWPNHKIDCRLKKTTLNGGKIAPPGSELKEAQRKIERWISIHVQTILFCILQMYHFTPDLDPSQHFIHFELDPNTMQMVIFSAQSMANSEGDLGYFGRPEVKEIMGPCVHFYQVVLHGVDQSSEQAGAASVNRSFLPQLKSRETREKIRGCPQWPWVAAVLTRKWERSNEIIWKKQSILIDAIEMNQHLGHSFSEFVAPTLFVAEAMRMTPERLSKWDDKLSSIDLWAPMILTDRLTQQLDAPVKHVTYPYHQPQFQ